MENLLPNHLKGHGYSKPQDIYFEIDQQYADDISRITNCKHEIENITATVPQQLMKRNLNVNITKTEDYIIRREGPEEWKKCKYLGSLH